MATVTPVTRAGSGIGQAPVVDITSAARVALLVWIIPAGVLDVSANIFL